MITNITKTQNQLIFYYKKFSIKEFHFNISVHYEKQIKYTKTYKTK